jgi:glycosyltransferase involved in cell wall biosynthesis
MEATIGGTRRHLVDVARGQRAAGADVHVVVSTLRDPGFPADVELLEAEGVGVTRLPMLRAVRPRTDLRHLAALKALLRELRPAVVHTHSSKAGVLGRQASLATGIGRRVHTPHTFAFLFDALFGAGKRRLYRAIEGYYARRTDRLIAVSRGEAETFARAGIAPAAKVRVVPNGVDPSRFEGARALDLASVGLTPGRPTAVVVGLVYPAKGQDLALAALAAPGLEELQLLCVGPGDDLPAYERRAREAGLGERVRFTGARDDVPAVLAAADVVLLPSRWEGLPYVVLEAMAASRPVVATPVDGARELVDHGRSGFLAESVGAAPLAACLRRFLALDPLARRAMGAAGRARLEGAYTLEHMVRALLDVYAELEP